MTGTSRSATWVVISTTRNEPAASIIAAEAPGPIGGAPLLPGGPPAHRDPLAGGDQRDLLLRADHGDLGVDRCAERLRRDLGPHAAGIAERHREARPHVHPGRSSTRVARRSRSM